MGFHEHRAIFFLFFFEEYVLPLTWTHIRVRADQLGFEVLNESRFVHLSTLEIGLPGMSKLSC